MLNMRINQLKRNVIPFISTISDPYTKEFAESVMNLAFGDLQSGSTSTSALIVRLYDILSQIDILGQIFSRILSKIAAETASNTLFFQLNSLILFSSYIIPALSENPPGNAFDPAQEYRLSPQKFNALQEDIRSLKKSQNQKITSMEGLLQYMVENAEPKNPDFIAATNWTGLLSFIFGVDANDEAQGVKELEQINIKELLLSEEVAGPFIDEIFQKYDGLLVYSMSLLTMLSGTKYSNEFNEPLGKLLDSLGTSSQTVMLQSRLTKNFAHIKPFADEIMDIQNKMVKRVQDESIEVPLLQITTFFHQLNRLKAMDKKPLNTVPLKYLTGYESIFSTQALSMFEFHIQKTWNLYNEAFGDLINSLNDLNVFYESIIKRANVITADLFSKGFQAAIPLLDVEVCEKAGIHLKNITATSSTMKINIPDEYLDKKMKLLRLFDTAWKHLKEALTRKCVEEQAMVCVDSDLKLFSEICAAMDFIINEWNARAVFSGYGEEVVFAGRVLYSSLKIFENMLVAITPIEKIAVTKDNLNDFLPVIGELSQNFAKIKNLAEVVVIINSITKNLWLLNREYVLKVTVDPEYFHNPASIKDLIKNIPKIMETEYRQRLIPLELKTGKIKVYDQLIKNIGELEAIGEEKRDLLVQFQEIPNNF
jgi:hypothetical protein